MGVKNLRDVIKKKAPNAIQMKELKDYSGQTIAIDILIDFIPSLKKVGPTLEDQNKNITTHLVKLFDQTIRMLKIHIKPVYVFDGIPPESKKQKEHQICDQTVSYANEAKMLLNLMGIPFVEAPSEAEAQCSDMVKCQKVDCAATIDMDALPFKTKRVLRNLTQHTRNLEEIQYELVLNGLNLNDDEFIDLCILLGCSYCDKILNIGPVKAYDFITRYRSIENVIENIDKRKFVIPQNWDYENARMLLKNPMVKNSETINLEWQDPDENGLIHFFHKNRNYQKQNIPRDVQIIIQSLRNVA